MRKYVGVYNSDQISSMLCLEASHQVEGKRCNHYQYGERQCRKCNKWYKRLWNHNSCMICGYKLAFSSRNKHD